MPHIQGLIKQGSFYRGLNGQIPLVFMDSCADGVLWGVCVCVFSANELDEGHGPVVSACPCRGWVRSR